MSRAFAAIVASALTIGVAGPAVARGDPGLTRDNFVDVADRVGDVLDTSAFAYSMDILGIALPASASVRRAGFTPPRPGNPVDPVRTTAPCPAGGEISITSTRNAVTGELAVGDRFALRFDACRFATDASAEISGGSRFVVVGHRYEGTDERTELEFEFDDLGTPDMRWQGLARAELRSDLRRGTESYRVSYRDLQVTRGPHAMRWNFTLELVRPPVGAQLARIDGAITVDAIALMLTQDEPYAIGRDGHPQSGQASARDWRGACVQIEAQRRRFAYRYFRAGNLGEVADLTSQSRPYGAR